MLENGCFIVRGAGFRNPTLGEDPEAIPVGENPATGKSSTCVSILSSPAPLALCLIAPGLPKQHPSSLTVLPGAAGSCSTSLTWCSMGIFA